MIFKTPVSIAFWLMARSIDQMQGKLSEVQRSEIMPGGLCSVQCVLHTAHYTSLHYTLHTTQCVVCSVRAAPQQPQKISINSYFYRHKTLTLKTVRPSLSTFRTPAKICFNTKLSAKLGTSKFLVYTIHSTHFTQSWLGLGLTNQTKCKKYEPVFTQRFL